MTASPDVVDDLDYSSLGVLGDRIWRLNNLYSIKDKSGKIVPFTLNWAQKKLLNNLHYLNIILKARQLGITTFHALLFLDTCLFNSNVNAAIIADSKNVAREIFVDKVKFAYDNLPDCIRELCPASRDNANELRFRNGSVFRVGTSLRGGTIQLLHITEFAKICQENPRKAAEIMSGAINTVHIGQFCCIESTARGREGYFYQLCNAAQAISDSKKNLGPLDWKMWFFAWQDEPGYFLKDSTIVLTREQEEYFEGLEKKGLRINEDQKAWYIKKMATQGEYMKREYPSTIEEAFESAHEGYYFAKQMSEARQQKRICHLPYDNHARCFSVFDIGFNDETAIWIYQLIGKEIHLIDYYENSGEALAHYVTWLRQQPYGYERHYFPFDAASKEKGSGRSYVDIAREMGMKCEVLPRAKNELVGIENLRSMLPRMFFDEKKCSEGIKAVENFRKEWNDKLGCFRERSLHDWSSHGAKSLIYVSEAIARHSGGAGLSAEQWRKLRDEYIG